MPLMEITRYLCINIRNNMTLYICNSWKSDQLIVALPRFNFMAIAVINCYYLRYSTRAIIAPVSENRQ